MTMSIPLYQNFKNFMGPNVTKKFIQSTELLRAQIMEGKEFYINLENRFSQYKAENDDVYTSFGEEAVAHFLNLHEHIVASGRALVIPGYQESEEVEYEVIVDIIFEHGSPVFGQRKVFFDEFLISTKIKYPRNFLRFAY
ncbi:hypothetical protein GIB67_012356 [Kingdonia uniflora]|uniref:Uncharacterized protein n=1 Tax=Kingdonia uniflora TaxID=39325 RepID=A0A7J7MVH3_9MAGN|nr:hypothetical protein GIB67_012356 [Kingdonia uniflora]